MESAQALTCNRYAVIIPSLKPTEKLLQVIDGVHRVGFVTCIVVDDGSGSEYADWFRQAKEKGCEVLTHPVNRGKGAALRTAFRYVLDERPDILGVITADADGQHLPEDIFACGVCCCGLGTDFRGTVLGSRDFSKENVPWKSRCGNRITAGVFKLCCGIAIHDTQTGLRAFPRGVLEFLMTVKGDRYEYETEMLLDMKRAGMAFREVTITTVYEDDNRGSHFHPLRDSWRIYKLILKFLSASVAATLVDYGAFYLAMLLLRGAVGEGRILLCTVIARAISSFLNFNLNKKYVFSCKSEYRRTLLRYYVLAIPQMLLSAGILSLLSFLVGTDASGIVTLLKIPVDVALFLISFQIQREWVFRQKP